MVTLVKTFRNLFRSTHKIPLVRHFWSGKKSSHEEESCSTQDKEPASKCQEVDAKLPDSWSQPKVVIIGAGIAGLSAAQKLAQYGICDVTVLEAADKLVSFLQYIANYI